MDRWVWGKSGRKPGIYQSFDADADGTVFTTELEAGLASLLGEHDADGRGALSPDEFSTLFCEG